MDRPSRHQSLLSLVLPRVCDRGPTTNIKDKSSKFGEEEVYREARINKGGDAVDSSLNLSADSRGRALNRRRRRVNNNSSSCFTFHAAMFVFRLRATSTVIVRRAILPGEGKVQRADARDLTRASPACEKPRAGCSRIPLLKNRIPFLLSSKRERTLIQSTVGGYRKRRG